MVGGGCGLDRPMTSRQVRSERLPQFVSLQDESSLAEIDTLVALWGWRREGIGYRDEVGKMQIPVARVGA